MSTQSHYVVDVMTDNPVVVGPDASAWSADCLARKRNVHHLLVVDGYRLVGVVCGCDLRRAAVDAPVAECMCPAPVTIDDQETAEAAASRMRASGVGCLPVLDWSGTLRGVVTRRDLLASGALPGAAFRECAACGSMHGLVSPDGSGDEGTATFCLRCIEQARKPRSLVDDSYFTLGGGG